MTAQTNRTIQLPIIGMCCNDELTAVQSAIAAVPGVDSVDVDLLSRMATIQLRETADVDAIRVAVASTGCSVQEANALQVIDLLDVQDDFRTSRRLEGELGPSSGLTRSSSSNHQRLDLRVEGMCCMDEAVAVKKAIAALPGVWAVDVLLSSEVAQIELDPQLVDFEKIRLAVKRTGCTVVQPPGPTPGSIQIVQLSIEGMCCAEEATAVSKALLAVPGVAAAEVLLSSERAIVRVEPGQLDMGRLHKAVETAGCRVRSDSSSQDQLAEAGGDLVRRLYTVFSVVMGGLLFFVVAGELLGLFDAITEAVPWPVWLALVLAGGYPVLRNVALAAVNRRVTSHTLMTLGLVGAVAVGEWPAAVLLVFFMRVGDYVESFTTERVRQSVRQLTAAAPKEARVLRDGQEVMTPLSSVSVGDVVVVRPGEQVPIDGEVISGQATVDQASITGESMPVEVLVGMQVYAATICQLGALHVRTARTGSDTTFGRMITLVEEAEANRADVQRFADRFSGYYLPVVATLAMLTLLVSGNVLAAAAILVVACSCAFAIATPIAMMASIGASAREGVLIKGGRYLEALAKADVVLLDKTGTLTFGQPEITNIVTLNGITPREALELAAVAERYSEHPLAEALRTRAVSDGLVIGEPSSFEAVPGYGVRAVVRGANIIVGSRRFATTQVDNAEVTALESQGKTLMYVEKDGDPVAVLAASDIMRPEVPDAIGRLRKLGVKHIELITGDNERTAAALAGQLGIEFRANLLPEDKIAAVKSLQATGRTVVMVGDGVNDAPALAQADIGIAMGAAGSHVAIEAAHIALMREDWRLVPEVFETARRTMRVVRLNIGFTALYNVVGLSLAAFGVLPLVIAASAQSLPDLGMLGNSSRLLRLKDRYGSSALLESARTSGIS